MAKILQFHKANVLTLTTNKTNAGNTRLFATYDYPRDFPGEMMPLVPSIGAMITTITRYYMDELNKNEKNIIRTAEQLTMRGQETAAHLRVVHKIHLRVTTLSLWDKIKVFYRRFSHGLL